MGELHTDVLYARVSAQVSSIDGIAHDVLKQVAASAYLGTMAEMLQKLMNRIDSPSATIASGGSAGSVQITLGTAAPVSGLKGRHHGWPFFLSATGALSGSPTSAYSTTSSQIRKVLVTLGMSALPGDASYVSSLALGGGTVQFVYGSVFATSAGAVNSGGASAFFNKVPLPKASAGEIPIGWLNFYNSFTPSTMIANHTMITDYRVTQGVDLSAVLGTVQQP